MAQTTLVYQATHELVVGVTNDEQVLVEVALKAYRAIPFNGRIEVRKRHNENPEISIIHNHRDIVQS